ncbi:peroxiredoxin [Bradyrhizobium neotropicale]|uniref:peroxiredoxin n=1 Tax=Bradyrhizobium neotropicale TaxID=1497615 RepID=UPI001AD66859|nr:peroxiredoxin [Bradyrhizobium neotropicale]MBO4225132.1 redoxin domain-containing protein [Bradyrhizobium neotropicale]
MSKKTRKKSSKTTAKSSPATAVRSKAVASVKPPAAKARKAVAKKSSKAAKAASTKPSHKDASKSLKSAASAATKSTTLLEGAKAPDFRLPRDGGSEVSLTDFAGKKLVLFFYPRADTPGCTKEAIDFTRLKDAFAESGTEILGVSGDTVKAQESFRNKHQLAIPLGSDEQHEMLEAYGAWGEKSMYGRTFLGILRTTVLLGADGRIARIWRNVRVDGHAGEVLAAARSL